MFLTWDMTVKIGDFGLATQHQASISSASTLCGTPNYIAPEVLRKQGHSYEADIWALGCMMFAMLVGTPPFETKSLGRTYAKIAANEYEIPERLSSAAKSFITMLLHPDPKCRGHLHHIGHPSDLLSQPFFLCGYCPRKLPQAAANQPPILPLDSILNDNHVHSLAANNSFGGSSPSSMDIVDGNGSPSGSHKIRTTLRQKFSQMFTQQGQQNVSIHTQHHQYHQQQLQHQQPQYRPPADQLIFQIIEALEQWIGRRPALGPNTDSDLSISPISVVPIFVSKWIDYSNKYGFGYQLSDKTVGVLFNEGTRICQSENTDQDQCFEFTDTRSKSVAWSSSSPPPSFMDLSTRLKLLDYFARYMDENLAEGVILSLCANQMQVSTRHRSVIPQVVRWTRNTSAVIMELNNGSVQINFIRDHAKVIFWGVENNASLLLTYMATDKAPVTYNLRTLPRLMMTSTSPLFIIDQKISQSLVVLRDLAEKLHIEQ
jgi:serine/threonine protein kinase